VLTLSPSLAEDDEGDTKSRLLSPELYGPPLKPLDTALGDTGEP